MYTSLLTPFTFGCWWAEVEFYQEDVYGMKGLGATKEDENVSLIYLYY